MPRSTESTGAARAIRRLQRSPRVADRIPWRLRLLDLVLVLVVLPLALAVGLVLALAVFIDSPGPVFYRSVRIGRGGRPFAMLKFRTMRDGAGGPPLSAAHDERYTPLGRSLAASRLDELPQLWNVVKGDMRLVGPRPEVGEFVAAFPAEYETILGVPPGLTGPAQLVYATEGRVLAQVEDRAEYYRTHLLPLKVEIDVDYARRHSLWRDLRILLVTPFLPVRQIAAALLSGLGGMDAGGRSLALRAVPALLLVVATVALTGLLIADATGPL